MKKINQLPERTHIYCAHEYTLRNLQFAVVAEPDNADIQKRLDEVTSLRNKGISTIPSMLNIERLTNPFLRSSSATDLASMRKHKDQF